MPSRHTPSSWSRAAQAHGDWAFGEERYNTVLRDAEMLGTTPRALRERGRQQIEELTGLLRAGATRSPAPRTGTPCCWSLNHDRPATPEDMRRGYEEWTARARQFLHDKGLVSFPAGEECAVVPSPPFQRPVLAVASYALRRPASPRPCAATSSCPIRRTGPARRRSAKRLESNAYPAIPTTPCTRRIPGTTGTWSWPRATRRRAAAVRDSYFAEGWALYAERMMEENGFYDDLRHVMYRYEATLFRAARIVVDTSLHLGEMTHPEAVAVHDGQLVHDRADRRGRGHALLLVAHPGVVVPHRLPEILRIRDRYLAARGTDASDVAALRDFHDAITGSGTLPIALAERAVMATDRRLGMSTVAADVDQLAERYWQLALEADPLQATAVGGGSQRSPAGPDARTARPR